MRVGAEAVIPDEDVSGFKISVTVGGVLQVPCPTRRGDQFAKHAAVGVEQHQQVRGGKTAPFPLPAGQTEAHPQLLGVGHGKTGAVDVPSAVAEPTRGHHLLKLLGKLQQHRQREASAGLTIGRVGEVFMHQMTQFAARHVAVDNLLNEQSYVVAGSNSRCRQL